MTSGASSSEPIRHEKSSSARSPWFWVPSLYFSQGIPYVIVMTMSVVMYKRLGISNTDIALYTSWLYLPWVIKPLWSPFVDITRTKRFWVVSMQFLVSLGLASVAYSIRGSAFFRTSLFLFWIMAFASATHDIAADGFYMLSMSTHEQAWWVGMRSTFYRAAMIVGSGLLVVLAGVLENKNGLASVPVNVSATAEAAHVPTMVEPPTATTIAEPGPMRIIAQPTSLQIPLGTGSTSEAGSIGAQVKSWNRSHGFLQETLVNSPKRNDSAMVSRDKSPFTKYFGRPLAQSWSSLISEPLSAFLTQHFPKERFSTAPVAGNVGAFYLNLSKPPADGKSVTVSIDRQKHGIEHFGLARGDKGFRLLEGERLVFTPANWNQPAIVLIQLDPKLKESAQISFIASSGNIPVAWSITLFTVAVIFLGFSCWHFVMLPRPPADGPVLTHKSLLREFFSTLGSFFRKPGILLALAFILLYRFDEAQLVKVISPFLLDAREAGGLGLTTSQVGLAYGTFGILALTGGGLLGGFTAAKHGLKRMLPFMVCSMYLPKIVFVLLSRVQPENFLVLCGAVAIEQFGYGFGFTAFMLYMLYFADGPHKTAHYAICTGFMALGMMLPGMWSGWLADLIGYKHFFVWVVCSAIPGFILAMLLRIDPAFGKKKIA